MFCLNEHLKARAQFEILFVFDMEKEDVAAVLLLGYASEKFKSKKKSNRKV